MPYESDAITIDNNSFASVRSAATRSTATIPLSASNSSQKIASSASSSTMPSFEINSLRERARRAAR